jgi:hypothetical protein
VKLKLIAPSNGTSNPILKEALRKLKGSPETVDVEYN